jgi:hypothetical protein
MSFLSIALQRQAGRRQFKQTDIARASGLSKSYISRLMGGFDHILSDQDFTAVLNAFTPDTAAQAELVAARCMDARVGPGSDLVEVTIKPKPGTQGQAAAAQQQVNLSPDVERAFAFLRSQCPVNPDLEKHLVGFARILGME